MSGREDGSLLLRIERELGARSGPFVILVGLLLSIVAAALDALTGPNVSTSIFYLIPIGVVTFSRGRVLGAITVLVASAMRLVVSGAESSTMRSRRALGPLRSPAKIAPASARSLPPPLP